MPAVCRTGDMGVGVCPNHTTPQLYTTVFATGMGDVISDDLSTCITGTIGISTCGHNTYALTGAEDVTADGLSIHRVGDMGMNFGNYIAITGGSDVTGD